MQGGITYTADIDIAKFQNKLREMQTRTQAASARMSAMSRQAQGAMGSQGMLGRFGDAAQGNAIVRRFATMATGVGAITMAMRALMKESEVAADTVNGVFDSMQSSVGQSLKRVMDLGMQLAGIDVNEAYTFSEKNNAKWQEEAVARAKAMEQIKEMRKESERFLRTNFGTSEHWRERTKILYEYEDQLAKIEELEKASGTVDKRGREQIAGIRDAKLAELRKSEEEKGVESMRQAQEKHDQMREQADKMAFERKTRLLGLQIEEIDALEQLGKLSEEQAAQLRNRLETEQRLMQIQKQEFASEEDRQAFMQSTLYLQDLQMQRVLQMSKQAEESSRKYQVFSNIGGDARVMSQVLAQPATQSLRINEAASAPVVKAVNESTTILRNIERKLGSTASAGGATYQ
jgi:hypothetical protein